MKKDLIDAGTCKKCGALSLLSSNNICDSCNKMKQIIIIIITSLRITSLRIAMMLLAIYCVLAGVFLASGVIEFSK